MSIQSVLKDSEINMHQLSLETGLNSATLYQLRNGKASELTLSRAFKLADALGVDINEFREGNRYE